MNESLLEVVVENAADLAANDKEAFTKIRRAGLGASDSSIILGVNKWTTLEELVMQKRSPEITQEELDIGNKINVRKGADLEPLVLQKFCNWSGLEVSKPEPMYRLRHFPYLTVNFDGITEIGEDTVPVELKWVSPYAGKYWDLTKQLKDFAGGQKYQYGSASTIADHVETQASMYGIPPYYYTQVQQQMLGVDAPYAYLCGLFDKDWEIHVFKIYKDPITQQALVEKGLDVWNKIKA